MGPRRFDPITKNVAGQERSRSRGRLREIVFEGTPSHLVECGECLTGEQLRRHVGNE